MKIQKVYTGYTILLWFFWILVLILMQFSGNCYDCKNEQLFHMVSQMSGIVQMISLIPVLPVLWMVALIKSIMRKQYKWIAFNILSMIFSFLLWGWYFIYDIVLIRGA